MSPEGKAKAKHFLSEEFGQVLVDALKQGIEKSDEERRRLMEAEQKKEKQGGDQEKD